VRPDDGGTPYTFRRLATGQRTRAARAEGFLKLLVTAAGAELAGPPLATLGAGGGLGDALAIAQSDEVVERDHHAGQYQQHHQDLHEVAHREGSPPAIRTLNPEALAAEV